jgi:hypothetical protein
MRRTSLFSVLAIVVSLAVAAFAVTPAVGESGSATATASAKKKGKKCGKKGKKAAAAARKKCGKRKGNKPANLGPQMALGDYFCGHSSFQVLAGNRYTVNNSDPGGYRYYPDTGIVQFQGGSYSWAFGKYLAEPGQEAIEIYSNISDPPLEVGDYGWTCSRL